MLRFFISTFILLLLTFSTSTAQELPPIINYTSSTYNGGNQNWSITQSEDKSIFVANNDGLLELNGAKWILHKVPDNTIVRSVAAMDNIIYSGSYMDFGYWERSETNTLQYTSLTTTLDISVKEDEQFWTIITIGTRVLFQSLNRIYIFNTKDSSIRIIDSRNTIHKMFMVDNSIYFHVFNEGIYTINDARKVLVNSSEILKDDTVVGIFKSKDSLVITTGSNGLFTLYNNKLLPFSQNLNNTLLKYSLYSSMRLQDGTIVLGTISNGILKVKQNGEIDFQINQYTGLGDNTVLSLFEDVDHNIWIGLDNGVDCINLTSPFTNYIDRIGNIGTVYASKLHRGYLYLGTNQGLFSRKNNSQDSFTLIEGTEGQVWSLTTIDKTLFCGHNNGTFVIENATATLLSQTAGTWGLKRVPNNPNVLLQGNYNGLHVFRKVANKWQYSQKIEGFDISSRYFEFATEKTVLVSHEYKGVFAVILNNDLTKALKVTKDTSVAKGANSSIVSFDSKIFFASSKGIFEYNALKGSFAKRIKLSTLVENDQYISGKMIVDEANHLWFFTKNYINTISKETLSDDYKIWQLPIPSKLRNEMKGFENISFQGGTNYLFGTSQGYIVIDVTENIQTSYTINLDRISSGNSKIESIAIDIAQTGEFEATNNFISFEYSIPVYSKYLEAEYSYKLEGSNDSSWSNWSPNASKYFENLSYGDYLFRVKSRINNQELKAIESYSFHIKRPWYLTHIAIVCYFFTLGLLLFLLSAYYKSKNRKEQQRLIERANKELNFKELEAQKQIIQLNNEKLMQDIEARNRELAISTMSMIKKNNTLNALKEDLENLKTDTQTHIKPIIKKIDKTLNSKEDWEFFEEAFNHADKDFFKKVKNIHPVLTANDLRLCVYLRLNLSSKEIAPLLNISHRSVEIKRYRLRKKINLEREVNLNNYFIEM